MARRAGRYPEVRSGLGLVFGQSVQPRFQAMYLLCGSYFCGLTVRRAASSRMNTQLLTFLAFASRAAAHAHRGGAGV